jgi:hypothetical protein
VLALQPADTSVDPASWLDYAPIVIAALSLAVTLVLGLWNRGTAKRALELSERQEDRRDSRVDLHMNDSVSWRSSAADRLLGFHLMIANPTDRSSSLVSAELHLTYGLNGVVTTVKVPHVSDATAITAPAGVVPIELPARLDANDAVSGWFLFLVEEGLTGGAPVDRYDVIVRDVHGFEATVQVTLFREVSA